MAAGMARAWAALAACLLSACGTAFAAGPSFKENPWKGSGFGTSVVEADFVAMAFTGTLSHMGKVRAEGEHVWTYNRFSGAGVIVAANGHEVQMRYEGVMDESTTPFTFEVRLTVLGGTGRWAGATGEAVLTGTDDGAGVFAFDLDGVLRFRD